MILIFLSWSHKRALRACVLFGSLVVVLMTGAGCSSSKAPARVFDERTEVDECDKPESVQVPVIEKVHSWNLIIEPSELDRLHASPLEDLEADATLEASCEEHRLELEIQGGSSRHQSKLSYKFKFKKDFDGPVFGGVGEKFDDLFLKAMFKDQSFVRENISFDLLRSAGLLAPRNDYVELYINDIYRGLFVIVERVDLDYPIAHGFPAGGQLYKGVRNSTFADFAIGRDLEEAFELKGKNKSYAPLEEFVRRIQQTPATLEDFESEIGTLISIDDFITRMAWISFTQNGDATAQNYFLYHYGENQWELFPWDSDVSLSNHWLQTEPIEPPEKHPLVDGGNNYFAQRILQVPELRTRYIARYRELLTHIWTPEYLRDLVDRHEKWVKEAANNDLRHWSRPSTMETELEEIRKFFEVRRPVVLKELKKMESENQ